MQLGASFSHVHLHSLKLDPLKAIKEFNTLNLPWIRLGCYWNEIEKKPGKFTFEKIEPLLEFCESKKISVVLTVGMKAPRWPEYYIPNWLSENVRHGKLSKIKATDKLLLDATLNYLKNTVNHFRKSKIIKVWQIENEPLNPSGPSWMRIDSKFLKKEVELVRKIDSDRRVMISLWGNEIGMRWHLPKAATLADIVGLNFYLKHEFSIKGKFIKYVGPMHSKKTVKNKIDQIRKKGKKIWITELQAEPWEPGEIVTKKKNPPSFLPKHFRANLNYAKGIEPDVALLWGFEYWYWKKLHGDLRYWHKAKEAINKFVSGEIEKFTKP
jgi:hypothetical protein